METAIKVEALSKRYRIGIKEQRSDTLAGAIGTWLKSPIANLKKLRGLSRFQEDSDTPDVIWALKNVSFEVKQGEVVGIIGRNGAGKSTLLRILARITEPTGGRVEVTGRLASLLEVGTGFHPELTGRENAYLNGTILGMRKVEIDRKFDEIVEFSGVEKFIDTPVKHYSSGMRVRLAFSVAAHLEPEVLLVDEVLAVGDAAFQEKCLGKMGEVARDGRAILFVSHNLGALVNLCPTAVLLIDGEKRASGPSDEVVNQYLEVDRANCGQIIWRDVEDAPGSDTVRLHSVKIISRGRPSPAVSIKDDIQVQIEFWNLKEGANLSISIQLKNRMGISVLSSINAHSANLIEDRWFGKAHPAGLFRTVCVIPGNFLNEGGYSVKVVILTDLKYQEVSTEEVVWFTVHDTGAMRREYNGRWVGVVRPRLSWNTQYLIEDATALGHQASG